MSNLTLERLDKENFLEFISRHYFSAKMDNPEFYQGYIHDRSMGYIVLEDGRSIGAFGINIAYNGVGECWLFSTDKLNRYPIWMVKQFKNITNEVLNRGLHRVQMFVENTRLDYHRFAQILGFEFEGVLRKHSTTAIDHAVYSKIK